MLKLLSAIWALFSYVPGVPSPSRPADLPDEVPAKGEAAWLKLARAELGVKEAPGAANNPIVLRYYADAGHPEINADSVAWCSAFTGAMLERAGFPSSKSLMARSYMNWGKPVTKPFPGCVAVFSRGDPRSSEGHVGFFLKEDANGIQILGGNQSDGIAADQVCIGYQPKGRLLGYRQPVTAMNSRTMKASTAQMTLLGLDSAVVLESQGQLSAIGDLLGQIGVTIPQFLVASILLKLALVCWVIYARQDDATKKGR